MTFPLTVFQQTFEDAPSFADAVMADAVAGGGRFKDGHPPSEWLPELLAQKHVERTLVIGLAAWLTQAPSAAAISEAIRIARALELTEMAPIFATALQGIALNLLLQPDPQSPNQSIEDCLLGALLELMDASDPSMRATVLGHLRNAGLRNQEITLLLHHGSTEELRVGLPAVFSEDPPEPEILVPGLLRGKEVADILAQWLEDTPLEYRQKLWESATQQAPKLKKNKTLSARLLS